MSPNIESSPEPDESLTPRSIWDDRRRALQRVLGKQDAVCGDLYGRAIDSLAESPLGEGALVVASHCIRELVNRLPRILGVDLPAPGGSLTIAAEGLAEAWDAHGGQLLGAIAEDGAPSPVGLAEVLPQIDGVVSTFRAGRASALSMRSALAVGNVTEIDNPTVKRFKRATDVFERFRHPQGSVNGWPQEVAPLLVDLRVIEDAVEGRIGSFFGVAYDLRALLALANARNAASGLWEQPSADLFERVISRIGEIQHRRIFFAELRNPLWVVKLLDVGALDPPKPVPGQTPEADSWVPWPAGPYLVAVADEVPVEVAAALQRAIGKVGSREVQEHFVKAATKMPATVVAGLVPVLEKFPSYPLDPALGLGIAQLIERLGIEDKQKLALRLGNALLRPRTIGEPTSSSRRRAVAGIESYWYRKALARFLNGLAGSEKLLTSIVIWLEEAQKAEGIDPATRHDFSYFQRPSIAEEGERHRSDEIGNALVDAVRDTAIAAIKGGSDPEATTILLERGGFSILKRIARHVLAETVGNIESALKPALEHLLDRTALDGGITPSEYFTLARAALPILDDEHYLEWEALILAGPPNEQSTRGRIREHLEDGEIEDEVWERHADHWKLNYLGTIGADSLRGTSLQLLETLTETYGVASNPSPVGVVVSTGEGEASTYLADLRKRTPQEVVDYAREWEFPQSEHWNSGAFDVGQAFSTVVKERALEFSRLAPEVVNLPSLFVGRFFDGLREALDGGVAVEWQVLLGSLMSLPIQSSAVTSEDDSSEEWRYPIVTALHVIERGLDKRASSGFVQSDFDLALDFASRYLLDPDPVSDSPSSFADLGGDPINRALNGVQTVAIATVARLAHASTHAFDEGSEEFVQRAVGTLDMLLTPERTQSSAVAAAFGSAFGQLQESAPLWLDEHQDRLLTADWYGDVVSIVAVLFYRRPGEFFDVMSAKVSELIDRASKGEDFKKGWTQNVSVVERIGEHLVLMVLNDQRELTDPMVEQFFRETPAALKAAALGEIGRILSNDQSIPSEILVRAQQLWDHRAEAVSKSGSDMTELSQFYMWVHSGAFPIDWWLPRLLEVVAATDFEGRTYLGEHLAEASRVDPASALEVLDRLIRTTSTTWVRYGLVEYAPEVIARAQVSGIEEAEARGRDLTDYLGREGFLRFSDLVEEAQASLDDPDSSAQGHS